MVLNQGAGYSSYEDMAKQLGLKKWKTGSMALNGDLATVLSQNGTYLGAETDGGKQFVIGLRGVALAHEHQEESNLEKVVANVVKKLTGYKEQMLVGSCSSCKAEIYEGDDYSIENQAGNFTGEKLCPDCS